MELLKIGDLSLQAGEIVQSLTKFGLLPRLIQETVVDDAIADIELTPEETAAAEAEFCKRNQITSPEEATAWAQRQCSTPALIKVLAAREVKLTKFKKESFEKDIETYFLKRKSRLDRVLYSLIRTQQAGLAQELYFRVQDDGQSFADLAREYSEGQEAKTGGLIGPVELSVPHPNLAGLLSISQPGQLWPPKRIGEWYIVVRLEKFFPARMDDAMRQRLTEELFQQWLKTQLQQTPITIPPVPSGAASTAPSPTTAATAATATTEAQADEATPSSQANLNTTNPFLASGSSSPEAATSLEPAAASQSEPSETDPWS